MHTRWVPPYYQRELLQKLQRLRQGKNSVEEYYQQLQTGLIRCGIVEENEAMLARFMGGLNREIQTILEYKDYTNITRLFHLACKAEREVQDRQALRGLTFLQDDLHHGHRVHPLLPHILLHRHLHQLLPPAMIQGSRHNHHYLPRAHLLGLHRVLLLPWHQQGTPVILFVVVVREEDILREIANLSV